MNEEQAAAPSKSARKRAALAVEELARSILDLPAKALAGLPLDATVRGEIDLARKVRGHGARKRQIKHLSALLRRHDEERQMLQEVLEQQSAVKRRDVRDFHHLEVLRENLCEPATFAPTLEQAVTRLPALDPAEVTRLVDAWCERGDKSAYRALFRCLRDAQERAGGS